MDLMKWKGGLTTPLQQWVERFFNDEDFPGWKESSPAMPAVNVKETPQTYEVEVAAPGYDKGDFQVSSEQRMLTIKAEHKKESESKEKDGNFIRKEFGFARFERRFTLPEDVREEGIKAAFQNGILTITLPRTKEEPASKARKVAVEG
jgi:HSP20 family protein